MLVDGESWECGIIIYLAIKQQQITLLVLNRKEEGVCVCVCDRECVCSLCVCVCVLRLLTTVKPFFCCGVCLLDLVHG